MAKLEPLNVEDHRHVQMSAPVADDRIFVPIVANEFAAAAVACPVFLAKSAETGRFYAGAMFGFRADEPPLIAYEGFRPFDVERQGFFISGEDIAIEVDNPRFSKSAGEPLFDEEGQPRDPLRRIQHILGMLHAGVEQTDSFIQSLLDLRLIEPIDISLHFDDGETLQLDGLYTASRDALHELDDADVLKLFRNGHLQLAYTMLASVQHVPLMARRRNERLAQGL